ncbi:MAG: hypothetical protein JXA20_09535 [Spirochaetes bacterium]|nr:hypothetical protein [Spirochaetota bacterium]
MKIVKTICVAAAVFLWAAAVSAQIPESSDGGGGSFIIRAGTAGSYSAGVSEDHYQARLFADATYETSLFRIAAQYTWYNHYQLSDGFGNFDHVDLNRAGLEAELNPAEWVHLNAGYRFTIGSRSYESHQYYGEASLFYRDASLTVSYVGKKERYTYNWIRHLNDYTEISGEIGYDFTERFGMEIDYTYSRDDYRSAGADYRKNMFHLGASGKAAEPLFITGGAAVGYDSSNYRLYSLDIGATLRVSEALKIDLFGMYTYYQSVSSGTSSGSGRRSGSASSSGLAGGQGGRNPYLSASRLGESFSGWDVSVSATMQLYRLSGDDGD